MVQRAEPTALSKAAATTVFQLCRQLSLRAASLQPRTLAMLQLLLLLLRPSVLGEEIVQSSQPGFVTGTLTSLQLPLEPEPYYYLYQQHGANVVHRLDFCDGMSNVELLLGRLVTVKYDKVVDGVMLSCSLPTEPAAGQQEQQRRRRRALLGESITTPLAPRILVYITSFCGGYKVPAVTKEQVHDLFLFGKNTEQKRSLAGYFHTCSYGQVQLQPDNVRVLGPVTVPCSGSLQQPHPSFSTGPLFTSRACNESDNMTKWHLWLDAWAAANHSVYAADYHHRVLILPKEFAAKVKGCGGFSGLASAGRWSTEQTAVNKWGTSLVWWAGDNFGDLEILLHELGHTYGMGHGTIPGNCFDGSSDQCEHACTMGAQGGQYIRCLNPAHNWQVGWGGPLLQLSVDGLPYGAPISVHIPPQLSAPNSSVMLSSFSGLSPDQRLFISARINTYPYDLPWERKLDGVPYLLMHTYNGTDEAPYLVTVHVGEISRGQVWRDNDSVIAVRFDSWTLTGATAQICRRRFNTELDCNDGRDDDCDFLIDFDDPDCYGALGQPLVRFSSPPPPSPSPPPELPPGKPKRPSKPALSPTPRKPPKRPSPPSLPSSPRPRKPPPKPLTRPQRIPHSPSPHPPPLA